ncbi:MAG TPA: hypothetical protein VEH62_10540, partial [Gemmatimonadales bacterium]|nr:hypothetical protein [Gemmatimonadales bacterium]
PVASNRTPAGRRRNMRVEIRRLPPPVRQAAVAAPPARVTSAARPAPVAAAAPPPAAPAPSGAAVRANAVPEAEAVPTPAPAPSEPKPQGAPKPLPRAIAAHAPAATVVARPPARDRGGFGVGLAWAWYNTSYWFYGGGNSRWQSWSQFQASGFYEGRFPLRVATVQTRYRIELRVGTGGATNNVGSGYVGNGASLTNGTLTGGASASLRLPVLATAGTRPVPYVGLGIDYSYLWGFGDNSGSIYGKGWNERILCFPLVAGVDLRTAHLTISPEIRWGILGSAASNLYLPGAGYAIQENAPGMKGIFVSLSWR